MRFFRIFHRQFLAILLLGILMGASILAFVVAGEIYDYQDTVDGVNLPTVDAIVCLAGGRGRIAAAGDLWIRYKELNQREGHADRTPVLFISGMGPKSDFSVVASHLRDGVRKSIRPENVMIEAKSENTVENAYEMIQIAKERQWHRILLITSHYHMKRSVFLFRRMIKAEGLDLKIETLTFYQEPFEPGEWQTSVTGMRVTIVEYVKWIFYRFLWTT